METVFWLSALLVGYVYVGYPVLIALLARFGRGPRKAYFLPGTWPSISVIVAARNEAQRLPGRIRNLLDTAYPGEREIIVVSDGSTDGTADALAPFAGQVRLIELAPGGKPQALNAGVAAARGDILVFADARQRFAKDALQELLANFNDEAVGGATGELVLDCEAGATDSTVGDGVGLYWKYEKWQRRNESQLGSTLGGTGAIYALRRRLWQPLPPETLLDDVLAPMRAVLAGYRMVFDERAIAFDRAAPDAATETRRKTRTLAGNYQILAIEPRLLLPFVNPVWLQYGSHKVGRILVPWALVSLFVSSLALAGANVVYTSALVLQLGFYGLAAVGAWFEGVDARSNNLRLARNRTFDRNKPLAAGKEAR
jgi:cellulose synthase/poly-beta-1,6-N-acetylglucosamine synthase-like glycosyltransferase